jgi:oxygen-dependent protoporphyrinogen oxidase
VRNVWVISGGISGLACAYRLRQLGIPARLLEKSPIAGGVICTERREGFLFEAGPQSFLFTDTLRNLIGELGLESEVVLANLKAPRYVLRDNRLLPVPMTPPALLRSSLLSWRAKAKLLSEPFRRSAILSAEESVADFVRRKFGGEILEYLVAPFISGVYAGDPETLSMASAFPSTAKWEREYGSVIRGAWKSRKSAVSRPALASFRNGMAALPERLAEKLAENAPDAIEFSTDRATSVIAAAEFSAAVTARSEPGAERDVIVLATPAHTAAALLANSCPGLAELLVGIFYAPLATIALAFPSRQIGHPLDGFGFLAPRKEGLRTLGTVWNSALFPGRAPQGIAVLTSFIGGATDLAVTEMPDDQLLDITVRENSAVLKITGPPVEHAVFRYPRALPQYVIGHSQRLSTIVRELDHLPSLFLTGNYLAGPSIGDCVEHAFATAEAVNKFLQHM